jgi:hypothetical protein
VWEVERAACQKYSWLRPDSDPCSGGQAPEVPKPAKPQLLYNLGAAKLADLYTQKNRVLGAIAELKRKGDRELQQQELRRQLAEIEAEILRGQILLEPMYDDSCSNPSIYLLGEIEFAKCHNFFGTRKLSPNHLRAEDFACPGCGERIWRTKQPIDLGQRKRAVLWVCGCIFFGLPPALPGMKLNPLRLQGWIENLEEVSRRNGRAERTK